MNAQATLTIPKPLYERARLAAENQRRDVSEVVAEVLEQAFPPLSVDSNPPVENRDAEREITAFHRLHPWLLANFANEYAAIYQGELVDHDPDVTALLGRIDQRFPENFVLIRPVLKEPDIVYRHRSVRWDQ
jgi:hypothetical protein